MPRPSQPLVGPPTGLSNTDSFLNIQQTGEVFYAPQVGVPGAGASGAVAALGYPELVTVDVSQVPANTQATLFFDLVGVAPASSSVRITNVALVSGAVAPPVSFVLDPATDSGVVGDNLTNFNPVNIVGTTDPNQAVSLDTTGNGFNDGTTTADASGHFTFAAVPLAEGANPVRVRATNAQGSTIPSQDDHRRYPGSDGSPRQPGPRRDDQFRPRLRRRPVDRPRRRGDQPGDVRHRQRHDLRRLGRSGPGPRQQPRTLPLQPRRRHLAHRGRQRRAGRRTGRRSGGQRERADDAVLRLPVRASAVAQSFTTAQDAPHALTLTGADFNTPPQPLTFTVTAAPLHGTLSGTAPSLSYTPAPGYFGPDSLQFKANNGLFDSNVATVAISVVGRPIANPRSITGPQDAAAPITLVATDPNSPALPVTLTITANPLHGTLSGAAPDVIYTPNAGYFGPDSFQYEAGNGVGDERPVVVSLAIVGRPTANAQSSSTVQGRPSSIVLTATDPNSPPLPLTFTVTAGPAHGTLSGAAPDVTYTPDSGYLL